MPRLKLAEIGTEARNKLMAGAEYLAKAVGSTLGPFGQNWLLEKGNKVTNDGVTIAQEIELRDELENRGVIALRESASKTNDKAGDGTTTSIVLANAILKEAVRYLGDDKKALVRKKAPTEILNQIEKERKEIVITLEEMATPISTLDELTDSAIVSVEDDELGEIIAGTQWDLGPEGIILAEETAERQTQVEKIHGVRIDNGFGTSLLMNNQEKQALEVKETRVILTNYVLKDLNPLKKVIDQLVKTGLRNLTVVARGFTPECIQVCLQNINQGGVKIYPINAPYVDQTEMMKDLEAILGGTYYHDEERQLEDMQVVDVGYAELVFARRYDAILTGRDDEHLRERVSKRVEELKQKVEASPSDFEKKNIKQRIAQLTNGFALLKVAGNSDIERKRRYDKAVDAVNATRHAFREGVVPGAGLAFKQISDNLTNDYLLKRPLLSIYEQIMASAPEGWTIPDWVKDPVFVLKTALNNACAVAGTLATAAGVTATERDKPRYVQETNKDED